MSIILRENEKLIKTVHRHAIEVWSFVCWWVVVIALFFLIRYGIGFDFGGYWQWGVAVLALIAIFHALYRAYLWRQNAVVITDRRVIQNVQHGIFSRTATELRFDDIVEASYEKRGMQASFYDYGDIHLRTKAGSTITMSRVPRAHEVVELLNTLR